MTIDLLLKSFAVCAAGLGFGALWPGISAAERHSIGILALVALLLLPPLATVLPRWELAFYPGAIATVDPPVDRAVEATGGTPRSAVVFRSGEARERPGPGTEALGAASNSNVKRALILIWATVATAFLGRWLLGFTRSRDLLQRAEPVVDARYHRLAREVARELGIAQPIRLRSSDEIRVPVAAGIVNPVILLPRGSFGWAEDRLRVVLLHEVAHVRRRDVAARAIAGLTLAVYWFHPGVWLLARMCDRARERACDDLVLLGGSVPPATYAGHLVAIARSLVGRPLPSAGLGLIERGTGLRDRIEGILDRGRARRSVSAWKTAAFLCVTALVATTVAAAGPSTAEIRPSTGTPSNGSSLVDLRKVPRSPLEASPSTPGGGGPVDAPMDRHVLLENAESSGVPAGGTRDTLPMATRRSVEEGTSAAWGSIYFDGPAEIERKEHVLRKWMEGGSGAILDRLRDLLGRPGGDFYLHLRGGRVDRVVLRPVDGSRLHLLIRASDGITGSLSGTWDPGAGAVNLFWLWGVEQETLEVDVPRDVDAVTVVAGGWEVLVAHPFAGARIVRVDLR